MTFDQLGLFDPIQKALDEEGYVNPTPIQAKSIPHVLDGRDLLGCAQTGTGKTAAFAVPIIHRLEKKKQDEGFQKGVKALVVTPTRELAIQIGESFSAYSRHTKLRNFVIFGGVNQNPQVAALRKGVDVLIATPGRLLDLHDQGFIRLDQLSVFVLDEADRMLDMGFVHDVKRIIRIIPEKRQSLFFSATMPKNIQQLADTILTKPVKVEVTPVSSTAETVSQSMYMVAKSHKKNLLLHVLQEDSDEKATLVFTRTKHGADRVARILNKKGIKSEAIHGDKAQNARQRALKNFKSGSTRVLVATDIAARGIDVDELSLVINYEIPNIAETYVHRIGRTGRAGASGHAISFCDEEEKAYVKDIEKLTKQRISVVDGHPWVLGEVEVPPKQDHHRPPRQKGGGNRNGGSGGNRRNSRRR